VPGLFFTGSLAALNFSVLVTPIPAASIRPLRRFVNCVDAPAADIYQRLIFISFGNRVSRKRYNAGNVGVYCFPFVRAAGAYCRRLIRLAW
jgi:hypothetical protein